jgi:hypothetical protein
MEGSGDGHPLRLFAGTEENYEKPQRSSYPDGDSNWIPLEHIRRSTVLVFECGTCFEIEVLTPVVMESMGYSTV